MILINGREENHLSARDRGLQFGDGIFETMAVQGGRALCLQRHLKRLAGGCARLAIALPERAVLEQECARVSAGAARAVLKLIVTRGAGGRGYAPAEGAEPTRIVARYPWPRYAAELHRSGVRVRICETRLGRNARLAGIKHLNRLEQVLARMEADSRQCHEGLMLDDQDNVIEGIMSNVFVYRRGRLCTPDLSECGVAGIMRELVLETAKEVTGFDAEIGHLSVTDLLTADECFLSNSLIGIWPVSAIEETSLHSGSVAHTLRKHLVEHGIIASD
jgi:4-amino-4-deoxychorismate lyase